MSADSRRKLDRGSSSYYSHAYGALSSSFTLPPSYVASASPRPACRRLKKFIYSGSTVGGTIRVIDWMRGQLGDFIVDDSPLSLGRDRGGRIAPTLQPPMFRGLAGWPYSTSAAALVLACEDAFFSRNVRLMRTMCDFIRRVLDS